LNNYPDLERKIWNNIYNKNFEKQIAVSGLREEEIREYIDIDKIFILLNINKPENNEEILNTLIREKIIKKNLSRYEITNL
jgi:cell division septum initiation protein DivIVA